MNKLGKVLAELRKERNLGQKELAVMLHLSIGTVSNYENGVHNPDLDTLCALADIYGVSTDYLLGRTEYRPDPTIFNRHISKDFRMGDIVNIILACRATGKLQSVIDFAQYCARLKK